MWRTQLYCSAVLVYMWPLPDIDLSCTCDTHCAMVLYHTGYIWVLSLHLTCGSTYMDNVKVPGVSPPQSSHLLLCLNHLRRFKKVRTNLNVLDIISPYTVFMPLWICPVLLLPYRKSETDWPSLEFAILKFGYIILFILHVHVFN